jgi:hypothetical protein
MSWYEAQQPALEESSRHARDRFLRRGEDLILKAALAAIEKHRSPTSRAGGELCLKVPARRANCQLSVAAINIAKASC